MRKTMALALAGALILSLATAGLAQAVNSHQSVAVKLAHSKAGTAAKPKSVGALTVDMNVALDPADPAFATRSAVIHFDKGLVFNSAKFPSCTEAQVLSGAAGVREGQDRLGQGRRPRARPARGPGRHRLQRPGRQVGAPPRDRQQAAEDRQRHRRQARVRQRRLRPQARRRHPGQPPAAARPGVYATLTSFMTSVGGSAQGHALRRAEGLLGRQAQVQGRLRLHRRLEAVADVDRLLHEVGSAGPAACPERAGGAGA